MLLLQTLPISADLNGIPTEQSSDAPPSARVTATSTAVTQLDDASPSDGAVTKRLMLDGASVPCLLERPGTVSLRDQQTAVNVIPRAFQGSCLTPSDVSEDSVSAPSQSSRSTQTSESRRSSKSSQSSQTSDVELNSGRSEGFRQQEEPAAETSRQRYDKLFRYFQTLDSAHDCCSPIDYQSSSVELCNGGNSTADSRRSSSDESTLPVSGLGVIDSCGSSESSGDSGGGQRSAGSANCCGSHFDSSDPTDLEEAPRCIGYAGFIGVLPLRTSDHPEGYAGYEASADFTCLRSSGTVSSKQGRAPPATRGATRPRRSPIGGMGQIGICYEAVQSSVRRTSDPAKIAVPAPAPALASVKTTAPNSAPSRPSHPGVGPGTAPVPLSGMQPAVPTTQAPNASRLWGSSARERKSVGSSAAGLSAEPPSPVAAWYQDFDELMGPCRGDRPLPPRAGRLRYRQPTPSRETLRLLRERVCLGCTRAFPESNYFDVYYHVNTVYRWFNWKLDA